MKWANAICALALALTLAAGPAVADDQQSLNAPGKAGSTSLKPPPGDGGGVFTTFGDPDDIIDGNRGREVKPGDNDRANAGPSSWWEDLLLLLVRILIAR